MENPLIFLLILLGLISAPIEEIDINTSAISDKLIIDFYKSTCPNAQQIVSDVITKQSQENEGIIPGIIRLHFHDCHVTVSLMNSNNKFLGIYLSYLVDFRLNVLSRLKIEYCVYVVFYIILNQFFMSGSNRVRLLGRLNIESSGLF